MFINFSNLKLKPEKEIISNWQKMKEPLVQIRCITYNHSLYIERAIQSFLCQKTTFPFVIYIYDDSSTDGSQTIIKKYADLYPHIIQASLSKNNLKKSNIEEFIKAKMACKCGKYLAICEGDDYWVSDSKLQMQIDYMEKNPHCSITYTNGFIEDQSKNIIVREDYYSKESKDLLVSQNDHDFDLNNIYLLSFPPTASFCLRRKYEEEMKAVPICPNGDLRVRMFFCLKGTAHYFSEQTCVYRVNVPNSAMSTWKKEKTIAQFERALKTIKMLDYIDTASEYRFSAGIYKVVEPFLISALMHSPSIRILKQNRYYALFTSFPFKKKITTILKLLLPACFRDFLRTMVKLHNEQ